MSRATGSLTDIARIALAVGCAALLAGCTVFGGTATARYDGRTLETASTSTRIGPDGAETRSTRTVVPVEAED